MTLWRWFIISFFILTIKLMKLNRLLIIMVKLPLPDLLGLRCFPSLFDAV